MDSKKLEKSLKKNWACPKKCDVSKRVCKHLERLLKLPNDATGDRFYNPYKGRSDRPVFIRDYSRILPITSLSKSLYDQEVDFRRKLNAWFDNVLTIDIIIDKLVYNKDFKTIAFDRGIYDGKASTARYYYKRAMRVLKEKLIDETKNTIVGCGVIKS